MIPDIDRPLNNRGHSTAPKMAHFLGSQGFLPDIFYVSPAMRALKTAEYFAKEFKIKTDRFQVVPRLYMADIDDFITVIQEAHDLAQKVVIFSHNPGVTEFANICCDANIPNMPTCSVLWLECDIENWQKFEPSDVKIKNIFFPKEVLRL